MKYLRMVRVLALLLFLLGTGVPAASGLALTQPDLLYAAPTSCPGATFAIPSVGKIGWSYRWPDSAPGSPSPHTGIDILGSLNDDVYPAYGGTVIQASSPRIRIRHHDLHVDTYYTHLNEIRTSVGATVTKDQLIGRKGDVGAGGLIHLHFSVVKWPSVNPEPTSWLDERYVDNTLDPSIFLNANVNYAAGATDYGQRSVADRCGGSPPGPLGAPDLGDWCRSLGHKNVTTVANNAYGLRCMTQSNGLVSMSVLDACKSQFHNSGAVDIMRNFNNPYDWQCYDTGQLLGTPDLGAYCRALGYDNVVAVDPTAYGLRCAAGNIRDPMDVHRACQWQYGRLDVIDSMRDFNNPQDWKCWTVR